MVGQKKLYRTVLFLFVLLGATVMLYPLLWMVASSFKPELMIFKDKSLIIREFTVEHYIRGWQGVSGTGFLDFLFNSFKVVVPVVIGNLLSCSMVGFAIARLQFPGKNIVFYIILLTMMLPMHATLIPRYVLFLNLDWIDSYKPLTVPSFFRGTGILLLSFYPVHARHSERYGPGRHGRRVRTGQDLPQNYCSAHHAGLYYHRDFFIHLDL
jgi:multiple sugar transport system permease protein